MSRLPSRTVRTRLAVLAVLASATLLNACSSTDTAGLPSLGTGAPNTPGSMSDDSAPPGSMPGISGSETACAGAPFELTVRTGGGEQRTVRADAAVALQPIGTPNWVFATGDVALDGETLSSGLPDPAGKTLVIVKLSSPTASTSAYPLRAGDSFSPPAADGRPPQAPTVDVQVKSASGDSASTDRLSGSVKVEAVTSDSVCLRIDLTRDNGAQASGAVAARMVGVNPTVFAS